MGDVVADPYGEQLEDHSILQFTKFSIVASRKVLMASMFDQTSLDEEMQMEGTRPDLGPAWQGLGHTCTPPNAKDDCTPWPEIRDHRINVSAVTGDLATGASSTSSQRIKPGSSSRALAQIA